MPVPNGEYCKTAKIGRAIMDADVFISLTHFKGHESTGFGGALKNIGMGCGSRAGKMEQHASGHPAVQESLCRGCHRCAKECGSDAIRYNGKITSDELRQALELADVKQSLEESLDVELDDDVFEDLGDVPVSIWIDVKSGMIVRIEMDMSDVMQGLVPVLVDKAMEKTDVGIGVNTKVYEVTVSITLSEFDAVQVTKPTTLNIG